MLAHVLSPPYTNNLRRETLDFVLKISVIRCIEVYHAVLAHIFSILVELTRISTIIFNEMP